MGKPSKWVPVRWWLHLFAGLNHNRGFRAAVLWSGTNWRLGWPPCGQQTIFCGWTRMAFIYAHRVFSKGPCDRPSGQQCPAFGSIREMSGCPKTGLFCMEYIPSYSKELILIGYPNTCRNHAVFVKLKFTNIHLLCYLARTSIFNNKTMDRVWSSFQWNYSNTSSTFILLFNVEKQESMTFLFLEFQILGNCVHFHP